MANFIFSALRAASFCNISLFVEGSGIGQFFTTTEIKYKQGLNAGIKFLPVRSLQNVSH